MLDINDSLLSAGFLMLFRSTLAFMSILTSPGAPRPDDVRLEVWSCLDPHSFKHWSKTQTTVSLASGEADLHGICAGVAQGIGLQSICRDLGFGFKSRIESDATAAIGIARCRGMFNIWHLDCAGLRGQDETRSSNIVREKILGTDNPADAFTKRVPREMLQ